MIFAYSYFLGSNVINLLSIPLQENSDSERRKTEEHLVYIKDLDLFMRKRTKYGKKWETDKRQLCMKCLIFFKNKRTLKNHSLSCTNKAGQAEFYPENGETAQFENYNHKVWLLKSITGLEHSFY